MLSDSTAVTHARTTGEIVTKHNATVCGTMNKRRLQAMSINRSLLYQRANSCMLLTLASHSGDIEGTKGELLISNRIFNSLRAFSEKSGKSKMRLHDKEEYVSNALRLSVD